MTDTTQAFLYEDGLNRDEFKNEKYLTFYLGDQLYGLRSSQVIEIMAMQQATYMPKLPDYINGVLNLRGKIIPQIELRTRIGFEKRDYDKNTCIIVVEIGADTVGFVVDRIDDVEDIPKAKINPSPTLEKDKSSKFLKGISTLDDGRTIILFSGTKLLQ